MLIRPSDILIPAPLDIDFPSPLPFSRLGVPLLRWLYVEVIDAFDFRVELRRDDSVASGLGGKLFARLSPLGGCGNELMLTVLRMVLPAPFTAADTARGCGSADVGAGVVGGRNVVEGARIALFGVFGPDLPGVGIPPVLFLVFVTGSAGSAMVGGPTEGREGRGKVVAILCLYQEPLEIGDVGGRSVGSV
jgi:hypothetical protein